MTEQYILIGTLNLLGIFPDFVLPVFKNGETYYFQDGENNTINRFEKVKETTIPRIVPTLDNRYNSITISVNSAPLYAFQTDENHFVIGDASRLCSFFETYQSKNEILTKEINDFYHDVGISKDQSIYFPFRQEEFHSVGRRKKAIARVRLIPGNGNILINKRSIDDYFCHATLKSVVRQPLVLTDTLGQFDVIIICKGGGFTGQAGAIRHGIARALVKANSDLKPAIKKAGYLTRDPRMKERKKYGLKSARRAPQFSKR